MRLAEALFIRGHECYTKYQTPYGKPEESWLTELSVFGSTD